MRLRPFVTPARKSAPATFGIASRRARTSFESAIARRKRKPRKKGRQQSQIGGLRRPRSGRARSPRRVWPACAPYEPQAQKELKKHRQRRHAHQRKGEGVGVYRLDNREAAPRAGREASHRLRFALQTVGQEGRRGRDGDARVRRAVGEAGQKNARLPRRASRSAARDAPPTSTRGSRESR